MVHRLNRPTARAFSRVVLTRFRSLIDFALLVWQKTLLFDFCFRRGQDGKRALRRHAYVHTNTTYTFASGPPSRLDWGLYISFAISPTRSRPQMCVSTSRRLRGKSFAKSGGGIKRHRQRGFTFFLTQGRCKFDVTKKGGLGYGLFCFVCCFCTTKISILAFAFYLSFLFESPPGARGKKLPTYVIFVLLQGSG